MKPLSKNIIIEPIIEKSSEGIIITKEEEPYRGKVIAIGSDIKEVKVKDIVIWQKHMPVEVDYKDKKYLIAKEEDLLAKII